MEIIPQSHENAAMHNQHSGDRQTAQRILIYQYTVQVQQGRALDRSFSVYEENSTRSPELNGVASLMRGIHTILLKTSWPDRRCPVRSVTVKPVKIKESLSLLKFCNFPRNFLIFFSSMRTFYR